MRCGILMLDTQDDRHGEPLKAPRKPYHKPRLSIYGSVSSITQSGAKAMSSDHGGNNMS
jgi:hypothetical protein